ncbi:bifunctional diaminohydroxyphosphoribosylaminopyrimidine deaminase/5-amino-6-(5-phosphoribosylamino)uracil reductase RibD [Pelotomaculum propionicicum]|uniref:Riboflavin biosynthesis protein RibD n=1 Tax=Pelotomaculum propionicicum TaxID=258475 RepID=A0A4Y7RTK5_9FIRM|nr:bifunctional diaminohydroxyphosphoribosylaminopyrimidine deaminase/5-amino-6-(5-phosphoribosylamino)uracil reductase RibD [Pelotomaculum propionicicum]NLI13263.1 bifunctional diaminohydroxyphosphoribosylaminopyrimidine deaminase/5-amino-6-(5-phosphoribosylamino)uracil reductase RibD [Peptococcaceae bacterium]TEB12100.1 Riboflavin biosynthesis protein RibD [Pelotomaculum propionicicum]
MDRIFMKTALELAVRARGRTSPNPMVGAVVVREGKIIGQGYHLKAGTPHAEIHALNEAGQEAKGATLYVTLEPCCHHGRTGPCTEAVINAGIARVVAAMADPNPLVAGKGLARLREAGIDVTLGVMEKEALRLNEVFIKYITTGSPFVVAKAAMSLDGKIATRSGKSKWITGPAARAFGHRLRDWYDAILVGIGTVLADDPSLTTRLPGGGGRDPVRVILDSRARIPPQARVLTQQSEAPTIIAVTSAAPPERLKTLRESGAVVLVVNEGPRVDLAELLRILGSRGITSVLIEGGAGVHGSAISAGLVDKVAWFIAPKIIGGATAPGPVGGTGADDPAGASALERVRVRRLGPDILLEGYFKH